MSTQCHATNHNVNSDSSNHRLINTQFAYRFCTDHRVSSHCTKDHHQTNHQTYQLANRDSNRSTYLDQNNNQSNVNLTVNPLFDCESNAERTTSLNLDPLIFDLPQTTKSTCSCDCNRWLCCQLVSSDYLNNIFIKIKNLIDRCKQFDQSNDVS